MLSFIDLLSLRELVDSQSIPILRSNPPIQSSNPILQSNPPIAIQVVKICIPSFSFSVYTIPNRYQKDVHSLTPSHCNWSTPNRPIQSSNPILQSNPPIQSSDPILQSNPIHIYNTSNLICLPTTTDNTLLTLLLTLPFTIPLSFRLPFY